tara:strand:+ start:300 stop:650 length:351 start_codon:yes stop_codon:yes gene_type:complete
MKYKSNDIVKPAKKDAKPRSKLQQVQAQANWAVHFKLQPFGYYTLSKLVLSRRTEELLMNYKYLVDDLKTSIAVDAVHTKKLIRERDAKIKADAKEIAEAQKRTIENHLLNHSNRD